MESDIRNGCGGRVIGAACLLALSLAPAAGDVRISEFMASNAETLADEDGDFSDWIELTNTGAASVDLAGWMLTDESAFDSADPDSVWVLPSRQLAPGASLVIFASGKDRSPAGTGELHANFQLSAGGEYLGLVMSDGGTIAHEFAGGYPPQRADISYGTGAVAIRETVFAAEGAAGAFAAGSAPSEWRGGSEPYDDSGWRAVHTGVGFDAGGGPTGFELVDDFEALNPGGLNAQNGWTTTSTDIGVVTDPAAAENQVVRQTGDNVRAWKAVSLPQGETGTLFFRMRRGGIVNISAGMSDVATPGGSFADFETQVNNQNDSLLKVRDGGAFQDVETFAEDVWYSVWMVVDNAADEYAVYWKPEGSERVRADTVGGQDEFAFRNGSASNPLVTFFARTGTGTSGSWYIDDIYLASGENLGDPTGAGAGVADFISADGDVEAEMRGVTASGLLRVPFQTGALPSLSALTLRMRYDDGFVAWLNGVEIARRNAPVDLGPGATAVAERSGAEQVLFEEIDVTGHAGALAAEAANILAVQGLNVSAGDGDFLITPELSGILSTAGDQAVFFTEPTPGAANGSGFLGFVEDTRFSADRGFYDAPVTVDITTGTPGASIIYTTDGSVPTPANGTLVEDSAATLVVRETTTLRAAAFKEGYLPTNVDTHTYIFVSDVALQDNAPDGYPSIWKGDGGSGSFPADYEMDPEVVNAPAYADVIDDALLSIPTISIVTDRKHLFDPAAGIYQNPQQSGPAWERPVSFEIIYPDGSDGVQVDAGLRIQGGHTRLPSKNPKHSFRVSFRSRYGDAKLRWNLFREYPDAAREFDQIVLRGAGNQSWLHHNTFLGDNRGRAQYIRDQWAKDTQIAMGHPGTRNTYAHVYLNGLYWGLYNPTERASNDFGESYLGGDEDDYVALNSGEPIDGAAAASAYQSLVQAAEAGLASAAAYDAFAQQLDVVAFADYIILMQFGANLDWDDHNWYGIRNLAGGGKWYFIAWDSEFIFISENDNILGVNFANKPSRIFNRLMANSDFRRLFADRVHRHCFNGGLLTPESALARWDFRKDQVYDALVAESARWGDYRRDIHPRGAPTPIPLYDRNEEWQAEYDRLISQYFPVRTDRLVQQYRARGFYLDTDAPVFSQHGGPVPSGYILTMGAGEIWFTTDGSEPDGSPTAQQISVGGLELDASVTVKARRVEAGEWSALTEATFLVGALAGPANLGVSEIMYDPEGPDGAEFVELVNLSPTETIDLSGVRFSDGISFEFPLGFTMNPGERTVIVRDAAAFEAHYGPGIRVAGEFADGTALNNGGETLALAAADGTDIFRLEYDSNPPWPSTGIGEGHSIVYRGAGDVADAASWRISALGGGSPGGHDAIAFSGDPLADGDGDGLPALAEHFLARSEAFREPTPPLTIHYDGAGSLVLIFESRIGADDVTWRVEELRADGWIDASDTFEAAAEIPLGDGKMRTVLRRAVAARPASAIFRLALSLR